MLERIRTGGIAVVAAALSLVPAACGEPTGEDQVVDTMRRVESIRGLASSGPGAYRFVGRDDAFDDLLADWRESDAAVEAVAEGLAMERLGLLPPSFHLLDALEWSTRTGVLGYYDPETAELTVVTDEEEGIGPGALMVLAHEHVHALQDRHFGLTADDTLDDDQAAAFDALVEGDATLAMAVWMMKQLGEVDIAEIEASDIPTDWVPVGPMPALLVRAGEFPYADGTAFVFSQWDGDWRAVNALWAHPPLSTEQIMHPERYPGDRPVAVDLPDVAMALGEGWQTAYETVMGEMRIGVLLADGADWDEADDTDGPFEFPRLENAQAAEGWGGDRLLHVTGPGGDWAIVWQTTWDDAADAAEFILAAKAAFRDLPSEASVQLGTDVTAADLPHPVLVTVTPDRAGSSRLQSALEPWTVLQS